MHMRKKAKIFCFLYFLAIYQLKKIYKQHNSTKLDKGYRLVYKLSCLIGKKNLTFFLMKVKVLVKIFLKIFHLHQKKSQIFFSNQPWSAFKFCFSTLVEFLIFWRVKNTTKLSRIYFLKKNSPFIFYFRRRVKKIKFSYF